MAIFDAHARDRLQVFMDGQNLYGTLRTFDRKMDFKVVMDTLKAETRLVRAQYFTTIRPHQDNEKTYSVLDFLAFNGYTVHRKFIRDNIEMGGHVRSKGSIIGEMTAAMIDAADNGTDHIVLFSGDGELTAAIEACKRRDCRVTLVSSERTRVVSEDLRRACDNYVDLENLPSNFFFNGDEHARHAVAA